MPLIKFQDFSKQKITNASPVYFLAGEEPFLIDLCLEKIEKFLKADDLNKEVFYGGEASAGDILNAADTLPFLSEKRVVIVKDAQKLESSEAQILAEYLANPVDSACLIFLYNANTKKKSSALAKKCEASKSCVAVDCRKQYDYEVKAFIQSQFKKLGKTISLQGVDRIIEDNGLDLYNINNEIEKLSLYTAGKPEVTVDDIEFTSGYTKEINAYSLAAYIEEKNRPKALFVLEKLLGGGEAETVILYTIASAVRKILKAKSLLEESGFSESEVRESLKMHPYFARTFFPNLEKHDLSRLKEALKRILKADIAIKSDGSDKQAALEKIIIFVC